MSPPALDRETPRKESTCRPPTDTTPSIRDLRAVIHGRVIEPDDAEYDEARVVMMGGIDGRPAVIVRVADADDVKAVVALARSSGLELAVTSPAGGGTRIMRRTPVG